MKRFGSGSELLPENPAEYKRLHANAWPGVLKRLTNSNIPNDSIYFHTFDDGEARRRWAVCKPCLKPFDSLPPGECRTPMEEVFHHD